MIIIIKKMEEINTQKIEDSPGPSRSYIISVDKIYKDSVTEEQI